MIAADTSLIADVIDDEPVRVRRSAAPVARQKTAAGLTRWASPPPGLDRNWVYLTQLGLLLAVGVLLFGARAVGG